MNTTLFLFDDFKVYPNTTNYENMKQLGKLFTNCSFFLELLLFFWQDYSNEEIIDVSTSGVNEKVVDRQKKAINLKNIQELCENDERKV